MKQYKENIADVLVIPMVEDIKPCLQIATQLREKGIATQVYLEDKKMKAKLKYADKLHIQKVIIIGEDEIQNHKVTLKDMITGEQQTIGIEEAIEKLK